MDFTFSKEHQLLRRTIREFVEREVVPRACDIDENEEVPFDVLKKAAKMGLFGMPFPGSMGAGAGETGYCILGED